MEEVTRGFIESLMDSALRQEMTVNIEWVPDTIPITSIRELAIGYAIGILDGIGSSVWWTSERGKRATQKVEIKAEETIAAMIKRRLPEIIEKIDKELNR